MATTLPLTHEPEIQPSGRLEFRLPPALGRDDDQLFAICQANRELRIERTADGDLEIMTPTGAETGARNSGLTADMVAWARTDGRGRVFDSSTGFLLPNGAMRAPGVAWVLRTRLATLRPDQKRRFLPLAPDLVIELASPNDSPTTLKSKMIEWLDNGVPLGWLILPDERLVWCYRTGADPICLEDPQVLADAEHLPGLSLPLAAIWEPLL
jgi:Uma2 family endonuclease